MQTAATFPDRRFRLVALALIASLHLWALFAFGATFWIDSRSYVGLAEGLRSAERLAAFYESGGRWIFSHLQPGVSVLWLALSLLPEAWRWPALALFQHTLAAGALFFAVTTIHRYWPTWLHLVALLLLLFLPAYQAFHNALLTESVTSSLLLVAFAACLRLAFERRFQVRNLAIAFTALLLITQFRSYWGAAVALMVFLTLAWRRRLLSAWTVLLVVIALSAAAAFPIYRYARTGLFYLPEGGMNVLVSGLQVNPKPSEAVRAAFGAIDFPPSLPAQTVLAKGLDATSALTLGEHWQAAGLDHAAINRRAQELGALLRNDGVEVQINRVIYGLASIGSIGIYDFGNPDREIFRGMDMAKMQAHQINYYQWQSWASNVDYRKRLGLFFDPAPAVFPFEAEARSQIKRAWEPYVDLHMEFVADRQFIRDPLRLGQMPPDVWLLSGLAGLVALLRRNPFVAMLTGSAIAIAFATATWFPVGNTRYANPLLPLYLLSVSIALGAWLPHRAGRTAETAEDPPQQGIRTWNAPWR